VLTATEVATTTLILMCTTKFAHSCCAIHVPRSLVPKVHRRLLAIRRVADAGDGLQFDLRIDVRGEELRTSETTPTSASPTTDPLECAS
jgi:hypothetical protein